jgi:putative ABC transport system substrate-binding protein
VCYREWGALDCRSKADMNRANRDVRFSPNRLRLSALAVLRLITSSNGDRLFAESGGLIAYGDDRADEFRHAAEYIDRILKGAKPADLPIQQPTKFELVINLKTAKALGLSLSSGLLSIADEVIE